MRGLLASSSTVMQRLKWFEVQTQTEDIESASSPAQGMPMKEN
jgi:flavin-binding protein dodecin